MSWKGLNRIYKIEYYMLLDKKMNRKTLLIKKHLINIVIFFWMAI